MTPHGNRANDGKDLRPFCTRDFDSAVFQLMSQDTSRSVRTSHASGSRSIQTEILNFPVDLILQVSCDCILCCDWYALHSAGRQVALWPNPRPFPSVWNRVWPRETGFKAPWHASLVSLMDGWLCCIVEQNSMLHFIEVEGVRNWSRATDPWSFVILCWKLEFSLIYGPWNLCYILLINCSWTDAYIATELLYTISQLVYLAS